MSNKQELERLQQYEKENFTKMVKQQTSYCSWDHLIPLREKQQDEYQPEMEQIIEYGEYIGLEFPGDESLLYIAKQGITATLPTEWQACQTIHGDMLYRNLLTKQIQQEHPLDQYYRNKVIEAKKQRNQNTSNYEYNVMDECVLDAIEEENYQNTDSQFSGNMEQEDGMQILQHSNSTKRNHLRHEEQFTKKFKDNNVSQFFQPYRQSANANSKDLKIKTKNHQYQNFLAEFSEDYSISQPQISAKFPSQNSRSLKIQRNTDFSTKLSPQKSKFTNQLRKPSPSHESTQTIHKIKQLNQQLAQYKNQKLLKQTLLNQIKQTNKIKMQLIKQKLNKKQAKKHKISQKIQYLMNK